MNAPTVRQSFCRVCNCNCGILVRVEDGRVTRVTADPAHPVSAGYTCVKGRAQPELLARQDRLLRSRKRVGSEFTDIDVEQAMDEIADSRVPLAEVRRYPGGAAFPQPAVRVGPPEGPRHRFQVADPDMVTDLAAVAAGLDVPRDDTGLRLVCPRMDHVRNSSLNVASTHRGRPYNPAFLHPDDLAARGLRPGDVVRLVAARDQTTCVVDADPSLRRGLVSMAHAFGGLPEEDDRFRELGSSTSRLLANDAGFERYSGQPRMSAVPVEIEPLR